MGILVHQKGEPPEKMDHPPDRVQHVLPGGWRLRGQALCAVKRRRCKNPATSQRSALGLLRCCKPKPNVSSFYSLR